MTLPHALSPLCFVTASIGVAVIIPKEDRTPEYLLKQADLALYCAKAQGRRQGPYRSSQRSPQSSGWYAPPVLATSMAALRANRLAWSAMLEDQNVAGVLTHKIRTISLVMFR